MDREELTLTEGSGNITGTPVKGLEIEVVYMTGEQLDELCRPRHGRTILWGVFAALLGLALSRLAMWYVRQ